MYKFCLRDFRGFHSQGNVEIRPITLLIGENSAGKSSFLAAMKYILDFLSGEEEPSFNKDPFQLGTFQQIAHYRGGKAGRAREFNISLSKNILVPRKGRRRNDTALVHFSINFVNSESHPVVSFVEIDVSSQKLRLRIDGENIRIEYIDENKNVVDIRNPIKIPRFARSQFARYWQFILNDFRFRVRERAGSVGPDVDQQILDNVANIAEFSQRFMRSFRSKVNATSAIRTKPLRTYTPGIEARDGEGSHVPFELAKLYRAKNKDDWRRIKSNIDEFGRVSEMFSGVDLKSFGKTASDPFQIQFSSDGPKTNLVDLGYGTSQILPILYDISIGSRNDVYLIQQPEVHLHPKAQAALGSYFVGAYTEGEKQFVLETHSDFIVDRVRAAISKKEIDRSDVSILFFERRRLENVVHQVDLDENGDPIDPPVGYRSFFVDEQLRMLGIE